MRETILIEQVNGILEKYREHIVRTGLADRKNYQDWWEKQKLLLVSSAPESGQSIVTIAKEKYPVDENVGNYAAQMAYIHGYKDALAAPESGGEGKDEMELLDNHLSLMTWWIDKIGIDNTETTRGAAKIKIGSALKRMFDFVPSVQSSDVKPSTSSNSIEQFIGEFVSYDKEGCIIWGNDKYGKLQHLLDIRGWGAIQNLFKNSEGLIEVDDAAKFQDDLAEWIVSAINEKLHNKQPHSSTSSNSIEEPKVVCLCGSTRFAEYFMVKRWELEKQGIITFGINILPDNYFAEGNSHGAEQEGVKEILDELHKRKIDLSDEVFVLNVGGYIGESTRSEIDYAIAHNKPVKYLEPNSEQEDKRHSSLSKEEGKDESRKRAEYWEQRCGYAEYMMGIDAGKLQPQYSQWRALKENGLKGEIQ